MLNSIGRTYMSKILCPQLDIYIYIKYLYNVILSFYLIVSVRTVLEHVVCIILEDMLTLRKCALS